MGDADRGLLEVSASADLPGLDAHGISRWAPQPGLTGAASSDYLPGRWQRAIQNGRPAPGRARAL